MTSTRGTRRPPARDELDELSGDIDMAAVNEEYERTRQEQRGGTDFMNLPVGESALRFLPPPPGKKVPWVRFRRHRIPGSGGGGKGSWDRHILCVASVPAPDGSLRVCPICQAREPLFKAGQAGDEVAKKNASAMYASLRVIAEVVDVTSDQTTAEGNKLFGYGTKIDDGLIGILSGRGAVNFTSAKTGCPVLITREGTGLNTEYKNIKALIEERGPLDVEWLRNRTDLDRFLKLPTREEMAEALSAYGVSTKTIGAQRPAARRPAAVKAPEPIEPVEDLESDDDLEDFVFDEEEEDNVPY